MSCKKKEKNENKLIKKKVFAACCVDMCVYILLTIKQFAENKFFVLRSAV